MSISSSITSISFNSEKSNFFGDFTTTEKLMTVYAFTGQNREEQGLADGRFVLQKTDSVVYAASLEEAALQYQLTQENVVYSFRLIQQNWKTGET